jgi:hypothetical protein
MNSYDLTDQAEDLRAESTGRVDSDILNRGAIGLKLLNTFMIGKKRSYTEF